MNRLRLVFFLAVSSFATACSPATTYNRGIDISYHPSGKADGGERLVYSAVELKTEEEEQRIRTEGGVYMGELEVVGQRAGAMFTGAGSGASTLAGRVSIEAANRGATHFYAASTNVTNGLELQGDTMVPTSKTQVRFVLFRLEADAWDRMPANLRPETPVKTVASR